MNYSQWIDKKRKELDSFKNVWKRENRDEGNQAQPNVQNEQPITEFRPYDNSGVKRQHARSTIRKSNKLLNGNERYSKNEDLQKYQNILNNFKRSKASPARVMHKLEDVAVSEEQIKSLLVQNRSIYSGFTNTIRTEFRISEPENINHDGRMPSNQRSQRQSHQKASSIVTDRVYSPGQVFNQRTKSTQDIRSSPKDFKQYKRLNSPASVKTQSTQGNFYYGSPSPKWGGQRDYSEGMGSQERKIEVIRNKDLVGVKRKDKKKPSKIDIKPQKIKEGKWSEAETQKLLELYKDYRNRYALIAKHFPDRTPLQIKDRIRTLKLASKREANKREEEAKNNRNISIRDLVNVYVDRTRQNFPRSNSHTEGHNINESSGSNKVDDLFDYIEHKNSNEQYQDLIRRISSIDGNREDTLLFA